MRSSFSGLVFAAFLLQVAGGLWSPPHLAAETLYVKTNGTKLRAEDSARSKVVTRLRIGTPVRVLKKTRRFYQVSLSGGRQGWIFKFKLTPKAPGAKKGGNRFAEVLGGRQKFSARESASGSSIRGLGPATRTYARNKGISPQSVQAVENMENYRVDLDDVDLFLQEGQLGAYAP
ncbi:MAG: SH3 domain-containing protein [Nitrospinales bacterium]